MALTIEKGKAAFLALHFQNNIVHENGKVGNRFSAHVKQTNCLANARKVIEATARYAYDAGYQVAILRNCCTGSSQERCMISH